MRSTFLARASAALLVGSNAVSALDVDMTSVDSIKNAAATLAYDMMTYYKGNQSGGIIGVLPGPPPDPPAGYYWWESGAMWGSLIDYWHYTNDTSYNDVISNGVQAQVGENIDMMPKNWSQSMGNDDQAFWGMTAMLAAEYNFPAPADPKAPSWLSLAQAVFNTQAVRPDATCGGGLRWQVFPYLTGYDYKNSIANGCFFNIGARLARYTANDTYAQHAEKTWDWITSVGLMDGSYNVYDGAHIGVNCTDINRVQFSYNSAVWLLGAANMYDYTKNDIWKERTDRLLNQTLALFFPAPQLVAYEIACEPKLSCTTDMFSFKSYLLRWLAAVTKVAPWTHDQIVPYLKTSAIAAAKQCVGGANGRTCGLSWASGQYDGTFGVGQEMAAMSAIFVNLLDLAPIGGPLTNATGGTSQGNPNAGSGSTTNLEPIKPATGADRAGAGIVTTLVLMGATGMFGWMSV